MATPFTRRHKSKIAYVHKPFVIASELCDLVDKLPRSLRRMYRDNIKRESLLMAMYAKNANGVKVDADPVKLERRHELLNLSLEHMGNLTVILEVIIQSLENGRINKYQSTIRKMFKELNKQENRINGVISRDNARFKKAVRAAERLSKEKRDVK